MKTLIRLACLAAVLVFTAYHVIRIITDEVITVKANEIITKDTLEVTAYLARDEETVTSANGGYLLSPYGSGNRVLKGETCVSVYPKDAEETVAKIKKEEEKLALLKRAMKFYSEEKLEENIDVAYREIMKMLGLGKDVSGAGNDLLFALTAKDYFFDRESVRKEYEACEERIRELRINLPSPSESFKMPYSGYVFTDSDAFGGVFSGKLAKEATADEIVDAINTYRNREDKGESHAVVSKTAEWYMLCPVSKKEAEPFVKNTVYDVSLGGVSVKATLTDIRDGSEGNGCVLVLEAFEIPENFTFGRSFRVEITYGEERTYRIPTSSVRTSDSGEQGVYILSGGVVVFRRVEILKAGENYVLVKSQKSYGDSLEDRKAAEKQYNNGEVPPLSAGIYRGNGRTEVKDDITGDDGTVLVKRDVGDKRIDTFADDVGSPYKYLEENEQIIISEGKLYHGKILG